MVESTSERQPVATVVFDFDGTLIHGDCGVDFVRWLLARNPLRWLPALLLTPLLGPAMHVSLLRRHAVSSFLWLATAGLKPTQFDALLVRFVEQYPLRPIHASVQALREELSRGHRVVIATGAFQPLADALLRRLDVRHMISLVGSQARRWSGGLVVGAHCNREAKVKQLHEHGFPGPYLRAYSDSWSDRPLLDQAQVPILVNGNSDTSRRMRKRYGKPLRIVVWN